MINTTNIFTKPLHFISNQYAIVEGKFTTESIRMEFKCLMDVKIYVDSFIVYKSYFPNNLRLTFIVKNEIFQEMLDAPHEMINLKYYMDNGHNIRHRLRRKNGITFVYLVKLLPQND